MSSSSISSSSPLQAAYAQEQGQQSSAIADRATRMSAAVDAALRYDVTIPSVPVGNSEGNTTGIVSMGDYLIATGLIDKSYELFLDTARVMHNVTIEDVDE